MKERVHVIGIQIITVLSTRMSLNYQQIHAYNTRMLYSVSQNRKLWKIASIADYILWGVVS